MVRRTVRRQRDRVGRSHRLLTPLAQDAHELPECLPDRHNPTTFTWRHLGQLAASASANWPSTPVTRRLICVAQLEDIALLA